jgi:CIC family chloride channel protein
MNSIRVKSIRRKIELVAKIFDLGSWFRLFFLCLVVGVISGLGALALDKALLFVERLLLEHWIYETAAASYTAWPLIVVPALGGAAAGALAIWLAPEATGHGTDEVIRAFHNEKGYIRARLPLIKGLCSIFTIGTGGSAGKEGPIVQIGAGFGSSIARLLRLSIRDRRILMLAGVAGGIGAIFRAPLGGALFAAEMLYRDPDFEHDAVIPGVISSVTAYSVFTAVAGYDPVLPLKYVQLTFPSDGGSSGAELMHYALLSVLCALVAFLFVKSLRLLENRFFDALPVPKFIKPAIGGALLGALTLALMLTIREPLGTPHPQQIMTGGHWYLQQVVKNALDITPCHARASLMMAGFLGIIVLGKILATGLTTGSGGSGGLLFPALFLGGVTGGAYAKFMRALNDMGWLHSYFALTPTARAGMVLVGMGGVFAACTKTPIASLVMVSEITGSYGLAVPLMMTCASAYLLSRSFTLNEAQVPGISDSPAHRGDFMVNVLAEIKVADAITDSHEPEIFAADTPFNEVLERIKVSSASVFPIVDENQCLVGSFSLGDIRQIMDQKSVGNLVVAGDLGSSDVAGVTMDQHLDAALRIFTQKNLDEIPVVERLAPKENARTTISAVVKRPRGPVGTMRVIAMLSRRDLIVAYHRRVMALERADAAESTGSAVFEDGQAASEQPLVLTVELPAPESNSVRHPEANLLDEPPEIGGPH